MKLLDKITVNYKGQNKFIELYHGDLANLTKVEGFDLLVLSAFPNDYIPTTTSLIGSLHKTGLSVASLARDKEMDLRQMHACWLSKQFNPGKYSGIQFERILCFEPHVKLQPAYELIGDLFQTIMNIAKPYKIKNIGMPILATGDAEYSIEKIFGPLIEAAANWFSLGLELDSIKIVAYDTLKAKQAAKIFSTLKQKYDHHILESKGMFTYDYFISYSHNDSDKAMFLMKAIKKNAPKANIFIDNLKLKVGHAWQQEIFESLDVSKTIITLLSPSYLDSKICKLEFSIANHIQLKGERDVLAPIYLYSSQLPTYIELIQWIDCREGVNKKLEKAAKQLVGFT